MSNRQIVGSSGLLDDKLIWKSLFLLTASADYQADWDFDSLYVPFRTVASDLRKQEPYIFDSGPLANALRPSMSIPLIYVWVIKPFVTARDEALAQVNHLAHTDPLTNLPNRRMLARHFDKFMAGSLRRKLYGAVLLMDLDGFKLINDKYGHDAGDGVLVEIAERIMSITRMEDVAARLGGDEFIILISQLDSDEQTARDVAWRIADKLINLVNQPIMFEGKALHVGASIGIRLIGLEELESETAIREADAAMYNAKQAGRGCAVFHE